MIFDVVLVVGMPAAFLAVTLLYGIWSPWWTHRTGIGLFTTLAAATILTGLSALQLIGVFHHGLARAAYILVIVAVLSMGGIIFREQRSNRD